MKLLELLSQQTRSNVMGGTQIWTTVSDREKQKVHKDWESGVTPGSIKGVRGWLKGFLQRVKADFDFKSSHKKLEGQLLLRATPAT